MGNDFTQNYYQLELPLRKSSGAVGASESEVWPELNELNIPLELLEKIKSLGISEGTLSNEDPTFYNVIDGELQAILCHFDMKACRKHGNHNVSFLDFICSLISIKNIKFQRIAIGMPINKL